MNRKCLGWLSGARFRTVRSSCFFSLIFLFFFKLKNGCRNPPVVLIVRAFRLSFTFSCYDVGVEIRNIGEATSFPFLQCIR